MDSDKVKLTSKLVFGVTYIVKCTKIKTAISFLDRVNLTTQSQGLMNSMATIVVACLSRQYTVWQNTKFVPTLSPDSNKDSGFLPMQPPLFLALWHRIDPPIDTGGCCAKQLALHREISTARRLHENFLSFFSIFCLP